MAVKSSKHGICTLSLSISPLLSSLLLLLLFSLHVANIFAPSLFLKVIVSVDEEEEKVKKKKTAYYPVYQSCKQVARTAKADQIVISSHKSHSLSAYKREKKGAEKKRGEQPARKREREDDEEEKAIHITDTYACMLASLYLSGRKLRRTIYVKLHGGAFLSVRLVEKAKVRKREQGKVRVQDREKTEAATNATARTACVCRYMHSCIDSCYSRVFKQCHVCAFI